MTATMATDTRSPLETSRAYVAAWNAHDGEAVLATFDEAGTYVGPTLPGPIAGEGIAGYVGGLCTAFPDLHFDVDGISVDGISVDGRTVVARWRMRGTNTGPLPGAPEPTNGTCDLPGVDVITVGEAGIVSVVGYFDQKTLVEQLGLQAIVVPASEPPMVFGMSVRTDLGNTTVPGALSMTWIEVGSEEAMGEVQKRSESIIEGLAAEPGFIGWVGTFAGPRGHTLTAWTSPEAAESAMARSARHRDAVERVRTGGLGTRGFTSIWMPYRLNQQFVGCTRCGAKCWLDAGSATSSCPGCGTELGPASYL